jgi:hypothetical protein
MIHEARRVQRFDPRKSAKSVPFWLFPNPARVQKQKTPRIPRMITDIEKRRECSHGGGMLRVVSGRRHGFRESTGTIRDPPLAGFGCDECVNRQWHRAWGCQRIPSLLAGRNDNIPFDRK